MRDKDPHYRYRLLNGRIRLILILLLALFPLLIAAQLPVRGARLTQAGTIFQLNGTLDPGEDINPKIPLYQPRREFNYRLSATGGAGGEVTFEATNGGTPIVTGAAETGEVVWGTGALLNGTNVLTLANPSSVSVDFDLHLYDLPDVPYTWEGSASPTGQESEMRLTFPQEGLYTFAFTAGGGNYEFAIDDDYVQKQINGNTSATFYLEAGTHTLEIRQGTTDVDWSVAVAYVGQTFDTLPYTKSGEDVGVEVLPISLENAAQVNLVITGTGTTGDSLYLQVYDASNAPLLTQPAQVYADETFWTTFDLGAETSTIELTADGGNVGAIDYELRVESLPDPAYTWAGNAVAAGDHSHARVNFPTNGRYTFDFGLGGGRFQFALDDDYILKTVDSDTAVTYYVPAGVHDLHLIQDTTAGTANWSVDISLASAGNDALPYTKGGGMGEGFTEEWLPVAMDAAGTANLNVAVGGDPADDLVVEVYGPGDTTPLETIDAVLGTEDVWEPIEMESGVNRLRLLAVGNTLPVTYALELTEVPSDTLTGWMGRSLNTSSLHSSAAMYFSQTGIYRFSLDADPGFANLALDTVTLRQRQNFGPTAVSYYDMQVTAGDHTLHVLPDAAFPATEWTASVTPVAAGSAFFTFDGTLDEGVTVAPEYEVVSGNVDFNFELMVTGDAVDLTIKDEGGSTLWSGTGLPGETLWGTETLPAGRNRFILSNPAGGTGNPASVTLTLYYLPEAAYTWEGIADAAGMNSHVRVDFPQDALYTFDLTVASGRYQFALDDDFILKTVESDTSVTYFVPAGLHDLYLIQDTATGADWSVDISAPGDATDTLPYAKSGGLVGGTGNDFTEEWLTVALAEATPVNLLVEATDGAATESLQVEVYTDDTITPTLVLPNVYGGEEIWDTLDLPAGTSRLHLVADPGNAGDLGYKVNLHALPSPAYTWEGLSTDIGLDSHARVNFGASGLYTFTFGVASGRFQFRVNDDFIRQTVNGAASVVFYIPAGTHDLYVEPDPATGADWSVAVASAGDPIDTLPYTKSGGPLDGTFDEAWLPVNLDAATTVNVELTVTGDAADELMLEVVEGLAPTTRLLTLSPVYGGETVWATVDLPAGPARLRLLADSSNGGPLTYDLTLHAVSQPTTSWSGAAYDGGLNSVVTIDIPTDGVYLFEIDSTQGFANLVVDGSTARVRQAPLNTAYELYVTAGEHEVEVVQDPAFPVTEWTATVTAPAPGADFFTFDGTLEEGVTVTPEYPVVAGPLDFNFELTTTGDDVELEIRDAGGNLVWTGTALDGETLWGTGVLTTGVNTFTIANPVGDNAVDADVSLTLYTLPEAGYDWAGLAASAGMNPNSHVRVIFPDDALYTFDFTATTGSYQFRLNDDYLRKTVAGTESVTYFVPTGTHDLYIHQDPATGADWGVSISGAGAAYDSLPYTKDGGALDATTFTEEWLPLHLENAAQLNLASVINGTSGDSLTVTVYDDTDTALGSAIVYAGETRWITFDLPAGVSRLHLETDGGNAGDLAYDLTLDALAAAPYTWDGLADAVGGTSHARVTFPTSGLYTFTLTADTGRFQFRLDDDFIQKIVEANAVVAYYVPAGTHDLYIDQDTTAGADWSVAIGDMTETADTLPYAKEGGELDGTGNDFDEAWMPVYLGTPQRVNVELTVNGATSDSLELDVVSGFTSATSILSLGPVYGSETVWATVDLTGMDRLRLRAVGNDGPLSYTLTLHALPETNAVWSGVSRGVGVNSTMRLDTPLSGEYLVQVELPMGFASVDINGPLSIQRTPFANFYYEFDVDLEAGTHAFLIEQDPDFLTNSWTVTVSLTSAYSPTLISVDPISVTDEVSTSLTLNGTNFMAGAEVRLEGPETVSLTSTYVSPNELTVVVPAGLTVGLYDVVVENPDGKSDTLTDGLEVYHPVAPAPVLTSVDPISATDTTSTTITLTGENFMAGAEVRLEGPENVTLTSTYISDTELTAIVPAGLTVGKYNATVENPDGKSDTLIGGLLIYHPTYRIYIPLMMRNSS